MKLYVGTDGNGMAIYKDVVGDCSATNISEHQFLLSRRSDESLKKLCSEYEEILEEIYRELRLRATKE